ncbi:copper transporter [Nocardioides sediminis]|uniref:copper transporter n=1 Tax=Nocardioides sediminis TaxID=433648 RepID=UPI000D2F484E|nr:copper transporter [Nocardioides sediminis]
MTFRQHLTTLVAVFVALAVGIVLGGGLLSDVTDAAPAEVDAAAEEAAPQAAYTDSFTGAVAPTLVSGKLAERSVALVTAPGADEQVVTALTERVTAAGGGVTARYDLTETMVGPDQKALVDTLGSQLMTQQGDAIAAEATTYDRIGQLLGLAVATTTPEGEGTNGKGRAILESLSGADLVSAPAGVERRAPLVLVVLGDEPAAEGGDAILAGLVTGLARAAAGVVVTGDTADGGEGQLGRLRAEPVSAEVATVDGVESTAGQVTSVLALARALTTKGGAFGASGADGPVPLG